VQEPPASAATIDASTASAADAVRSAIAGADAAIGRDGSLLGLNTLFGRPGPAAATAPKRRIMRTETADCAELLDPPCSGSVTLDTDVPATASVIDAGRYIDTRFNALAGSLFGQTVSLYGRMRLDFQTRFDPFAASWDGLRLVITLAGFGGSVAGTAFGASAGDTTRYVDVRFSNWAVVGGRPTVGSTAYVSAGGVAITLFVDAVTSTGVVYRVLVAAGGPIATFRVTATYPAGGGAPSYEAARLS
jgi:hypothetical protein